MKDLISMISDEILNEGSLAVTSANKCLGNLTESVLDSDLPITVEESNWTVLESPERMVRQFDFFNFAGLKFFIDELLRYQNHVQHHSRILIEGLSIGIETFTHDVNGITESDIALSKFCDEIYDDVYFIRMAQEEADERDRNFS